MNKKKLVVLISGSGSNLQAIIDAVANGQINGQIVAVISNRADAYGLQRAEQAGIATFIVASEKNQDRRQYDKKLAACIEPLQADLIILAGFMRILSDDFVNLYADKMINIHPALLPAYKGLHTHQRALHDGVKWHGASVHLVTAELDGGPVILQAKVPVKDGDTEESLAKRVLTQEHIIYPKVVQWFCEQKLQFQGQKPYLDGVAMDKPIIINNFAEQQEAC